MHNPFESESVVICKVSMQRKVRCRITCALIAMGCTLATCSLSNVRFFRILNLKAYDTLFILRQHFRGPQSTDSIILLTADKKAMASFPELRKFWHRHYAEAVSAAAQGGAKVIGLDLAFGERIDDWDPGADELLAMVIANAPTHVVVGVLSDGRTSSERAEVVPANLVAAAQGQMAYANQTIDDDDFARRQQLMELPSRKSGDPPPVRSLALRVVENYVGMEVRLQNGQMTLNGEAIPIDRSEAIAINFVGGPNTFPKVSLADFEVAAKAGDKAKLSSWVKDKIVLIGMDSGRDRFETPFFTVHPKSTMAGVEIHANTIRTMLDHQFLLPVPQRWRVLALVAVSLLTSLVTTTLAPGRAAISVVLELLAILTAAYYLFVSGWIISSSELLVATCLSLLLSVVYRLGAARMNKWVSEA